MNLINTISFNNIYIMKEKSSLKLLLGVFGIQIWDELDWYNIPTLHVGGVELVYYTNSPQLSLLSNVSNWFTHQPLLGITVFTHPTPMIDFRFDNYTSDDKLWWPPLPNQLWRPILSSNNKLQWKSTLLTTFALWISNSITNSSDHFQDQFYAINFCLRQPPSTSDSNHYLSTINFNKKPLLLITTIGWQKCF